MPSRKEAPAAPKKTRRPAPTPAAAKPGAQPAQAAVANSAAPAPATAQPAARKQAVKAAAPAADEVFGKTPGKAATPKAAKPAKAIKAPKAPKALKAVKAVKASKPSKPAKPAKAPAADAAASEARPPKHKLVRDSFTIPRGEYQQLDVLKQRLVTLLRPTKKSELLRAGIKLLSSLADEALLAAVNEVPAIKTGRPGKP